MRHFFIMRKAQECYKSARPESCNRTCKISQGPLPYVLFPHDWESSQCPCVLGSVWGVLGFNMALKALPQLLRAAVNTPGVMSCAANMARYGWFQSWFRSHGSKNQSAKPGSVNLSVLDLMSAFGFPLLFFLLLLLYRNRNNPKILN